MSVNKDKVRLWVDALRSGEYEQGREGLARDGKFCCLGVACQVAIKDGLEFRVVRYQDTSMFDEYDGESGFMPTVVQHWLGILEGSPTVDFGPEGRHVAYLNDEERLTFDQIADLIEHTFLKGDSK